ncbi:acyl-homoserine-lactone synthase [Ponticoccus litoralis]|uniref:Acyl-homoserine-lactone synthase n=1 Tax=Ponticoccus litoralis TaxID=422297 RepID=A0AAW9SS84_9RHOB
MTVIDPIMNRVLKRSDCAPYDYVGSTKPMGKTSAMAALLDCSDERIDRIRAFAGIEGDVFMDSQSAKALEDDAAPTALDQQRAGKAVAKPAISAAMLRDWCREQLEEADTAQDKEAAKELMSTLEAAGMIPGNGVKPKRA